jgi:hypothetical protein
MSDCSDLIGYRYRLGATGKDGEIDCIHLVYTVLGRLHIPTPAFNPAWYTASRIQIARDLLQWGERISDPSYDGDVLLLKQGTTAFAVTWQAGILYICPNTEKVNWCPLAAQKGFHCFRMRSS